MIQTHNSTIREAYVFARAAHAAVDQRRKYTNEPYIVHPVEVFNLASKYTDDVAVLASCLLHDVVEDTGVEHSDVEQLFGTEIAKVVAGVTDVSKPGDGNRAARAAIDRAHVEAACERSQMVKAFDIISNVSSIAELDPTFAKVYLPEKKLVAEVLTKLPDRVYQHVNEFVQNLIDSKLS